MANEHAEPAGIQSADPADARWRELVLRWANEQIQDRFPRLRHLDISSFLFGMEIDRLALPQDLKDEARAETLAQIRCLNKAMRLEDQNIVQGRGAKGRSAREEFADWTVNRIIPAIVRAAAAEFRDVAALVDIVPPPQQEAWRSALAQWQEEALEELPEEPVRTFRRQMRLFQRLNDVILRPMHLYVGGVGADNQWHSRLGVLRKHMTYPSAVGSIEAFWLEELDPPSFGQIGAYCDYATGRVVGWENYLRGAVTTHYRLAHGDAKFKAWLEGLHPEGMAADMELATWVARRFPDERAFLRVWRTRVLIEEIRHAIDARRLPRVETGFASPGDVLLRPASAVFKQYWNCQESWENSTSHHAVMEISAQMTAAAVSPEPAIVFREWLRNLQTPLQRDEQGRDQRRAHDDAAEIIVLLLALYTRALQGAFLEPTRKWYPTYDDLFIAFSRLFGTRVERFADHARDRLARLAADFAQQAENEPQRMRLALQRIYAETFHAPIDELPFAEILSDGSLRQRALGESAL